jgi:glycerol uptake facilitator protein
MNPLGEFIGTMLLVIFGDGVVANVVLNQTKGQNSGWIVISAGWAWAVAIGVYAVAPISGGHINPAVTISLAVIGKFPWAMVVPYLIAQFLGAFVGAVLVWLAYRRHFEKTDNPALKLAVFSTGPAIRDYTHNLITEIIGTFTLVFCVLTMLSAGNLGKGFDSALGPFLVALLVYGIGLSLGGPTGYAVNPARDFAPRVVHAILPIPGKGGSDWGYSWVPVVGPIIGGILGALVYTWLGFGSLHAAS